MEKLFIVANFKSHMVQSEAKNWIDEFLKHTDELNNLTQKNVIIAPSFTLLSLFKSLIKIPNIYLASQDISMFKEGAYTGEINARQVKEFADYTIIGHSERRENFKENDNLLTEKVKQANEFEIKPIYCVQNAETIIPQGVDIIAYEPVFAIGSGIPDTPENADNVASQIINRNNNLTVLYGGSVNSENVATFTRNGKIRGVLVGGASLDPQEFVKIINNA